MPPSLQPSPPTVSTPLLLLLVLPVILFLLCVLVLALFRLASRRRSKACFQKQLDQYLEEEVNTYTSSCSSITASIVDLLTQYFPNFLGMLDLIYVMEAPVEMVHPVYLCKHLFQITGCHLPRPMTKVDCCAVLAVVGEELRTK